MAFKILILSLQSIEESYQALARQRIWKIQSSRAKSGGRSSCVGISGANLYLGPNYTFTDESRFSFFMLQVFQRSATKETLSKHKRRKNLLMKNVIRSIFFVYRYYQTNYK